MLEWTRKLAESLSECVSSRILDYEWGEVVPAAVVPTAEKSVPLVFKLAKGQPLIPLVVARFAVVCQTFASSIWFWSLKPFYEFPLLSSIYELLFIMFQIFLSCRWLHHEAYVKFQSKLLRISRKSPYQEHYDSQNRWNFLDTSNSYDA